MTAKKEELIPWERPYALKNSAVRAARQFGLKDDEFDLKFGKHGTHERVWWIPKDLTKAQVIYEKKIVELEEDALDKAIEMATDDIKKNGIPKEEKRSPVELVEEDFPKKTLEVRDLVENPYTPIELQEQQSEKAKQEADHIAMLTPEKKSLQPKVERVYSGKPDNIVHKSTVERPTKLVWAIADELINNNHEIRRKEIIAECVKRGIAFWTARTQTQQWFTARKNS